MNNAIEIKIQNMGNVFCKQYDFVNGHCLGTIKGYDGLYLICQETQTAKRLPEEYQNTPIYISPDCGGYKSGFIMVSKMGEMDLAYHHNKEGCAGLWGWIDRDLNIFLLRISMRVRQMLPKVNGLNLIMGDLIGKTKHGELSICRVKK